MTWPRSRMRGRVVGVLLLFVCASFAEEQTDNKEEGDVKVLTDADFDSSIDGVDIALVKFYAPWCGHCKSLAPLYDAAATELKSHTHPVALFKIDCDEYKTTCSQYDISGYPTLKVFRKKNESWDYEGPRTTEGIVSTMKAQADPAYTPPADPVMTLTEDNFDESVMTRDLMLVEFYAPWCGHCKKLEKPLRKAAQVLGKDTPAIFVGKVDATEHKDLATKYDVSGYPTLFVFRNGKHSPYNGPRDEHGIISYMQKQRGHGFAVLTRPSAIDEFLADKDLSVIGFFSSNTTSLYQAFEETADSHRDSFRFAAVFSAKLHALHHVTSDTVMVYQPKHLHSAYEAAYVEFNGEPTALHMLTFVRMHSIPLVGHRTQEHAKRWTHFTHVLTGYLDVDYSKEGTKGTNIWRNKLAGVAAEHDGDLKFSIADKEEFKSEVQAFGLLSRSEEEDMVVAIRAGKTKYVMEEEFSEKSLRRFVDNYVAGKLTPFILSEALPKKKVKAGSVAVVVGSTFEKIVMDPTKNVLVEFYAPWCGHCKKLEPEYASLAKKVKKQDDLVIAKMDATTNDYPPQFDVQGFPTLYFVPAGDGPAELYKGDRTVDDMLAFLRKQLPDAKF